MNPLHPLSKLNFLNFWFIEEELISFGSQLVIFIDIFYFNRLFPLIGEKRWKSLIPYYNWYQIYKRYWNRKAFFEHIIIEQLEIFFPLFIELSEAQGAALVILTLIDFYICFLGVRHHWEINEKLFECHGVDKKYLPLCLLFDTSLLKVIEALEKEKEADIYDQNQQNETPF